MMNISELVQKYSAERASYLEPIYNETQLRNDFIDPLLKCLGWDVDNEKGKTHFLRDVIQEEYIEIEDENTKKSPDYTLRINGTRKLFVEVKKPSVNILKSAKSAFQTRRYGWNANLGISVLTNFENIIIYDCRFKPDNLDNESVARIKIFNHDEYENAFEELAQLMSYDSANSGLLDDLYSVYERKGQTFDDYFLKQIEKWRKRLAESAISANSHLNIEDINFLIQRLLNRIIFLRICEDRSIEKFETLRNIKSYSELKQLFSKSDKKFNSGLFDFIDDNLTLRIDLDSEVLIEIFSELYYPLSPYDFSVVDPSILSQIYERFLGSRIVLTDEQQLVILEEPEVSASKGVVPTPKIIVDQIVKDTLFPLTFKKSYDELTKIKVADICCGSGTFLLSAYDFLSERILQQIIQEKILDRQLVQNVNEFNISLTLKTKRHILEQNLFGVDINPYAVEVSEFSLLLKLLEGENSASVESFISHNSEKVLPNLKGNIKCGNSLVDNKFFEFLPEAILNNKLLFNLKPFEWETEFRFLTKTKGFDAIIGNPPYVRIQNLVKYAPEEVKYYQSAISGYAVASKDAIDKYYVFIQRAIGLLNPNGLLGYIIPHKFFIIKGGQALRDYITTNSQLSKIIHFGIIQVFPERSTYTAILILQKNKKNTFTFNRIKKISSQELEANQEFIEYNTTDYNSDPWIFLAPKTKEIFDGISRGNTISLKQIAEISVGLQTSDDKVYIFEPNQSNSSSYIFSKNGKIWEVEKDICLPAIYKLSFSAFDSIAPNAQIIFPYEITNGKATLFTEEKLKNQFPLTYEYLLFHKEKLLQRKVDNKSISDHYEFAAKKGDESKVKWFQFGRSQSLTRFHNTPKLIWSVLATSAPYALDQNDIQFTGGGNGPYYALLNRSHYSLNYFLAILSHPLFENMVKSGASEFRGAYYSHGKQFIENIPIRVIDWKEKVDVDLYNLIIKTVDELLTTKKEYLNGSYGPIRTILKRKIDTLQKYLINAVNALYQISDDDYNVVINDEMFKTELSIED
ncbi:N-6 DNA methylase [uncultured Chryseobacterium sp.]|uniref:Eco57I restriction-modification methylase domain-containing protein n=1 Tax=uncultured Chryseobacterium sp. TaxID=259322 RepID=UPI0025DC5E02|nr:N-6 DNA methylase [uncultured Chryseobacterium sp.]